jgi:hypothetical protein
MLLGCLVIPPKWFLKKSFPSMHRALLGRNSKDDVVETASCPFPFASSCRCLAAGASCLPSTHSSSLVSDTTGVTIHPQLWPVAEGKRGETWVKHCKNGWEQGQDKDLFPGI